MKFRRITKSQALLSRPEIARTLALNAAHERRADIAALARLVALLQGRTMRPTRRQRVPVFITRRDPAAVARRYLRRLRGGDWHTGAAHIARHNYGPGIAWESWENGQPVRVRFINLKSSDQ